jgi:uncharacterized cupredoxin-like copper-binding protein
MKAIPKIALLAVAVVIVGAGCSSDDGASTDIKVTLDSFEMSPDSWNVPAGEDISITMTNDAEITHEWVILKSGVMISSEDDLPDTEEELVANFIYWEEEVEAGDTATFTFTAPAAGEYQVVCAIPDHFNAGMKGTLTVSEPGA